MFSPVYEDVSGLFGRAVSMTGYTAATGELQFNPTRFVGQPNNQNLTMSQQQQQPQQQLQQAYSFVDASGRLISSMQQQQQLHQQQNTTNSAMSPAAFSTFDGTNATIIPYEVYFQQQQQANQFSAATVAGLQGSKPAAATTFPTQEGARYYFPAPAGMMRAQASPLQQHGGPPTIYTIETNGTSAPSTPSAMYVHANPAAEFHSPHPFFAPNMAHGGASLTLTQAPPNAGAPHPVGANTANQYSHSRTRSAVSGTPVSNTQSSASRHQNVVELLNTRTTLELFDPDFKFIYDVPSSCVVHLPPPRLNITRLVLCRNYRPHQLQSCAMGSNCKFVHADCDYTKLETHPIHVNYIWRHEHLCTYPRLPAGKAATVLQADGQTAKMPSEKVLVTKGASAATANDSETAVSRCECYDNNGVCYQGERCNFIHAVHVDPNVRGDFKRAPRKRNCTGNQNATNHNTNNSNNNTTATVTAPLTPVKGAQSSHSDDTQQQQYQTPSHRQRRSGSLDAEVSSASHTSSMIAKLTVATNVEESATVTPSIESVFTAETAARLQEAIAQQQQHQRLLPAELANPQAIMPSFGIALTPFAIQTLTSTTSLGTLVYLPRGATEATVLGPVGAAEKPTAVEPQSRGG